MHASDKDDGGWDESRGKGEIESQRQLVLGEEYNCFWLTVISILSFPVATAGIRNIAIMPP